MIQLRKSTDRGHANHGWLDSYHSFSFADYYDANEMGWSALRVINEDIVEPGKGFGTHSHRDMEIFTFILEGALQHKDSMGNGTVIRPGDVQRMSAGSGVQHSEFNPSSTERVHLLQIWIEPNVTGITPSYEEKHFSQEDRLGKLRLLASSNGCEGSVTLHQEASILASVLPAGETLAYTLAAGRRAYLHVARGALRLNDQQLEVGDGAKISDETTLNIQAVNDTEFLFFDLP